MGSFRFFLKLYRDCTQNTAMQSNPVLTVQNHPTIFTIGMTLVSQTDITQAGCGVSCNGAVMGDVAVEEYVYQSDPVVLGGAPPVEGFVFSYNLCCRNSVTNLQNADNFTINYRAVMYALNGLSTSPCYDSSPQFAERPSALLCAGYQLRYNNNAVDVDGDSLAYDFVAPAHESGTVPYTAGYSATSPLPGPALNPGYSQVTLNPVTGQLEYNSPSSIQGKWTLAFRVRAFRCGQLISENVREMQVQIIPCPVGNTVPQAGAVNWVSPPGATGNSVTVQAGEVVSFSVSGTDNDLINGIPQELTLTAAGAQFGNNFSNPNAGCLQTPCATLTNSTPPTTSASGTVGTTFNWQTSCEHVSVQDQCGVYSNTFNFLFKFTDNYCPARATNFVNVSVTVVGEETLPSPSPRCADVQDNGSVTLHWQTITDNSNPPSFVAYVITHSTNPNGPFTEVGTVPNINIGTYNHATAITTGPNYYQIRTRSGCNGQVLSPVGPTIASIFLTLTDNVQTATLNWNPLASPPLPTSNGNGQGLYQVFKEYPAGTWAQIGTTFDLSWTDPVTVCLERVNYRVQLTDNLPCTSRSNIAGDTLNNPAQPATQFIDSVSVNCQTGNAIIGWTANAETNVTEYDIEQLVISGGTPVWQRIHTNVGYNNTFWENPNSTAWMGPEDYRIRARNNCNSQGLNGDRHKTMFLTVVTDTCRKAATLNWTPYTLWDPGVLRYDIYVSKDGAMEEKVGEVADSVYTFTHSGLEDLATYCYTARAIKNSPQRITSSSNCVCILVYVPKRPDYQYLYNATVNPGNAGITVRFFVDSTAGYKKFDLLRAFELGDWRRVNATNMNPATQYYELGDNSARPELRSYYYTVFGIDSCDLPADTMNWAKTVHLLAEANSDRTNSITWNEYEGWRGEVAGYALYREYMGTIEQLALLGPGDFSYTDPIREIIFGEGRFCYWVEAIESPGPPVEPSPVVFAELSRSNESCALQLPNVFMPNAFVPEGLNSILLPVTVYVDYQSYLFQVYNRWGGRIFETTDPLTGWDGTVNGNLVDGGVYGYFIQFVSASDMIYQKSGTVTLIR